MERAAAPNAAPTGPQESANSDSRLDRVLDRIARVPVWHWRLIAALIISGFTIASIVANSLVVDGTR